MNDSPYNFEVQDSIRKLDWTEWDSLRDAKSDPFMDPRFIEAVENSMRDQSRFRHIVIRNAEGRAMATACLSSFVIGSASLAKGPIGKLFNWVQNAVPLLFRSKLILCGLPVSAGQSHIRFAPDADRLASLRIIDTVARKFASAEWARLIIFKEIDAAVCRELAPLASLGYRQADSLPINHAPPGFDSFDGYLAHVDSNHRRKTRQSQRKFAKSGLRIENYLGCDGVAEKYTDNVHRLFEAVEHRSDVQFGTLPAEFFRELARQLPDNTAFTFVYRDDDVVGFSASIFSEETFYGLFVGLDYSLNAQSELYFNLLYNFVDVALRHKPKTIVVGQTADAIKHHKLGCHQAPMFLYVKGGRWSMRLVLQVAFSWIFPPRSLEFPAEPAKVEKQPGDSAVKNLAVEAHAAV